MSLHQHARVYGMLLYKGNRLEPGKSPLLDKTYEVTDILVGERKIQPNLEVLTGTKYRRAFSDQKRTRELLDVDELPSYFLQLIVSPLLEGLNVANFSNKANEIIELYKAAFGQLGQTALKQTDTVVNEANEEGPFGTARFEDSISKIIEPILDVRTQEDHGTSIFRLGVSVGVPSGPYLLDLHHNWMQASTAKLARRGHVVIGDRTNLPLVAVN
jgi:hypothetical protein